MLLAGAAAVAGVGGAGAGAGRQDGSVVLSGGTWQAPVAVGRRPGVPPGAPAPAKVAHRRSVRHSPAVRFRETLVPKEAEGDDGRGSGGGPAVRVEAVGDVAGRLLKVRFIWENKLRYAFTLTII